MVHWKGQVMTDKTDPSKVNLCDTCKYKIPECDALMEHVTFGTGIGNDNIITCTYYEETEATDDR